RGTGYAISVRGYGTTQVLPAFTNVTTAPRNFTTVVLTNILVGADGLLNLDIQGGAGNGPWALEGLDVFQGGGDPGAAPALAAVRRYDLNGAANATAAGFIGVSASDRIDTAAHGWTSTVTATERATSAQTTVDLYRDFHSNLLQRFFRVVADPGKPYNVRVYLGDPASTQAAVITVMAYGDIRPSSSPLITVPAGTNISVLLSNVTPSVNGFIVIE